MDDQVDGYVADVPYVRDYVRELAPAWLDHVAVISGFAPPAREDGFAWCDLGCGQGVTAVMMGAMHPNGAFHGIDMMPEHVDHARRFAAEAGLANAHFHAADFAAAGDLDLPQFDYIAAHGVYSWVSPQVRADMRRFIDRRLKRGGLAYLSYNAMPGRGADLPFQHLVRTIGETSPGSSTQRVAAALKVVDQLADLNAPALAASPMLPTLRQFRDGLAAGYLAHELMGRHWTPLFVTEVRRDMAAIGLAPAGSATLVENHDRFVLGKAAREVLATLEGDDVRELARDFLINQSFRRDVFVRAAERLTADEQRRRLCGGSFALVRGAHRIEYALATPAGRLAFDNPAARAIVEHLKAGPCRLGTIVERSGVTAGDIIANVLVLCASGQVLPVELARAPVDAINGAIARRLGGPEEIVHLALPCGITMPIEGPLRALLRGEEGDAFGVAAWRDFLAAHGMNLQSG